MPLKISCINELICRVIKSIAFENIYLHLILFTFCNFDNTRKEICKIWPEMQGLDIFLREAKQEQCIHFLNKFFAHSTMVKVKMPPWLKFSTIYLSIL